MSHSVEEQLRAARGHVLVHEDPTVATLVVTGGDRVAWLNGLLTCNVATLPEDGAVYGLAVTQKGRILADVVVVADGARLVLVVPASQREELRAALDRYLVMEDVELTEGEHVVFRADGPLAASLLPAARAASAVAATLDVTGLGGVIVVADARAREAVRGAIADAATAAGGVLGDDAGWEALRLERALPRYGSDFDLTTYPQEAALEKRAVSFDKGCYLGQEVVCMLEMRGHVKRKLVSLVVAEGAGVPPRGAELRNAAGAAVGQITSAAFSPTLGAPVALAMVKAAESAPGTVLALDGAKGTVTEIPAP